MAELSKWQQALLDYTPEVEEEKELSEWQKLLNDYTPSEPKSEPVTTTKEQNFNTNYAPLKPAKSIDKVYDNYNVYEKEYSQFNSKTQDDLKEFTYGKYFNDPEGSPQSINNARDYAMFMMNNEDDQTKKSYKFTPEDNQYTRGHILNMDSGNRAQEAVNLTLANWMSGNELTTEDLELVQKATKGDKAAVQELTWRKSLRSPDELYGGVDQSGKNLYLPTHEERKKSQERLESAFNWLDAQGNLDTYRDEELGWWDSSLGDEGERGLQNMIAAGFGDVLNTIPTLIGAHRKIDPVSWAIKGAFYGAGAGEKYEESIDALDKKLEDIFYDMSVSIKEAAHTGIDAEPATGIYARPPEGWLEHLDPVRWWKVIAENGPLMGVFATETFFAPPVAFAHMWGVGSGSIKTSVLDWEKENDVRLTDLQRETIPLIGGGAIAALDRLGLKGIMGKFPKAVQGRLMQTIFASGTESGTEGMQEFIEVWAAAKDSIELAGVDLPALGYREVTEEDWQGIKAGMYGGLIFGFSGGMHSQDAPTVKKEEDFSSSDKKLANNVTMEVSYMYDKKKGRIPVYQIKVTNRDGDAIESSERLTNEAEADEYYNAKSKEISDRLVQNGGTREVDGELISDGTVLTNSELDENYQVETEGAARRSDFYDHELNNLSKELDVDVNIKPRTSKRNYNKVISHLSTQLQSVDKIIQAAQNKMEQAEADNDNTAYHAALAKLSNAVDIKNGLKVGLQYADKKIGTPDPRLLSRTDRELVDNYRGLSPMLPYAEGQQQFQRFTQPDTEVVSEAEPEAVETPIEPKAIEAEPEAVEKTPVKQKKAEVKKETKVPVETRAEKKARLKKEKAERVILPAEQPTEPNQVALDYKYKGSKQLNLLEKRDGTWYNLQDNKPVKNKTIVKKANNLLSQKEVVTPKPAEKDTAFKKTPDFQEEGTYAGVVNGKEYKIYKDSGTGPTKDSWFDAGSGKLLSTTSKANAINELKNNPPKPGDVYDKVTGLLETKPQVKKITENDINDGKKSGLEGKIFATEPIEGETPIYVEVVQEKLGYTVKGVSQSGRVVYKILNGPLKGEKIGADQKGRVLKSWDKPNKRPIIKVNPAYQIVKPYTQKRLGIDRNTKVEGIGAIDLNSPVESVPQKIQDIDAQVEDVATEQITTDREPTDEEIYDANEGLQFLNAGVGLTPEMMDSVYKGLIETKRFVFETLPEKVRQQGEKLGINKDNFGEGFSNAVKGFGDLTKNTRAWFKKVMQSIRRWYRKARKQPIYKADLPQTFKDKYKAINQEARDQKIKENKQGKNPSSPAGLKAFLKNAGETLSARALKIGTEVKQVLRNYIEQLDKNTSKDMKKAEGFLEIYNKLKKEDPDTMVQLHAALLLRDKTTIDEIVKAYPLIKVKIDGKDVELDFAQELKNVEDLLADIWGRGYEVFGDKLGLIESEREGQFGYFPREVHNYEGLRQALRKYLGTKEEDPDGVIDREMKAYLSKKSKAEGRTITQDMLTAAEEAKIINGIIFRKLKGKKGPPGTKGRKIDVAEIELLEQIEQFYSDPATSLIGYIQSMNEGIAKQKLFGKGVDASTMKVAAEDYEGTIAELYREKLLSKDEYTPSEQQEIINIFSTLLDINPTPKWVGTVKGLGYIGTMADFINTLTQLGDTAMALGRSLTDNPLDVATSFGKAWVGKSEITMRDIYIDNISQEMRTAEGMMKLVNKIFKGTGLKALDRIGKETLVNSQVMRLRKKAIKAQKFANTDANLKPADVLEFEMKLEEIFTEGERAQAIQDLMSGELTDNTLSLAYNELLNHQPVAITELPVYYLKHPELRLLYQLKTWSIKTLNVMAGDIQGNYKQAARLEKQGNLKSAQKLRRSGWQKSIQLAVIMSIAGGGIDEIKDLILGKPTKLSDNFIDSFLRLFFLSRYSTEKVFAGDLGSFWDTFTEIPAIGVVENVLLHDGPLIAKWATVGLDKKESLQYGLKATKHIPFVGKYVYYRGGRGQKLELKRAIQDYNRTERKRRLTSAEKKMRRFYERKLKQIQREEAKGKKSKSYGRSGGRSSRTTRTSR